MSRRRRGLGRAGVSTHVDPTTRCKVCGEAFDWCTCDECVECGYPKDDCDCDEER
jgi:hypothetical protein